MERLAPGNLPNFATELSGSDADPDQEQNSCTRPPHSWSPCPGRAFRVRCGPNYAHNGRKAASGSSLYEVFGVATYNSERKLTHVGRVVELPVDPTAADLPLPPFLVINYMIPNYPPSGFMQSKKTNGPGWNLVVYCRLTDAVRAALAGGGPLPPSVDLFRRFAHPEEGRALRKERLKCIFGTTDTSAPGFNPVTKHLIQSYNFKPFLSKTASSFYSVSGKYFEIDVDIHTWGQTTLQAFNTVKSRMPKMSIRGGIVIEADGDPEMPEQMLFSLCEFPPEPNRDGGVRARMLGGGVLPRGACSRRAAPLGQISRTWTPRTPGRSRPPS